MSSAENIENYENDIKLKLRLEKLDFNFFSERKVTLLINIYIRFCELSCIETNGSTYVTSIDESHCDDNNIIPVHNILCNVRNDEY